MYKLNTDHNVLEEVEETTFFENDLKEREHIQEWIRKKPEVLGEDLLIIGCEFDKFEINERIDLLAIDKEGNATVIELKRDTTGSQVDFQALKYASYCARLSPTDLIEVYNTYIKQQGLKIDAKSSLIEFLEVEEEEELHTLLNTSQRLVIVGKEIDKRILSVCTWLYENSIDVKCIAIKPYRFKNGDILIDTNQILPPFKLEDYYINKQEVKKSRKKPIDEDIIEFLQSVSDYINTKTDYTARYGGKRDYFKGRKFLGHPWNFVFSYKKKDNYSTMFIESYDPETVKMIDYIGNEHHNNISEKIGNDIYLRPGVKNKNLLRLVVDIYFNEDQLWTERINEFNQTFVEFKKLLSEAAEEYKLNVLK